MDSGMQVLSTASKSHHAPASLPRLLLLLPPLAARTAAAAALMLLATLLLLPLILPDFLLAAAAAICRPLLVSFHCHKAAGAKRRGAAHRTLKVGIARNGKLGEVFRPELLPHRRLDLLQGRKKGRAGGGWVAGGCN